jgi:hypothetical protein
MERCGARKTIPGDFPGRGPLGELTYNPTFRECHMFRVIINPRKQSKAEKSLV